MAALITALAGCGGGSAGRPAATVDREAVLGLVYVPNVTVPPDCSDGHTRAVANVSDGTTVELKDGAGTIVAVAQLIGGDPGGGRYCLLGFRFPPIPITSAVYQVQVGDHGPVTVNTVDLRKESWTVKVYI